MLASSQGFTSHTVLVNLENTVWDAEFDLHCSPLLWERGGVRVLENGVQAELNDDPSLRLYACANSAFLAAMIFSDKCAGTSE